jgi:hypothetical protein
MPKVPVPSIGLQAGSSGSYDAPGGSSIPDIGGPQITQLGQAQTGLGHSLSAAARVMQDQIDDAAVTEGYTKWADEASSVSQDFLQRVGKDARGYYRAKALGEIEQAWRKIEAALENDVQRGMFREAVRKHMVGIKERIYGHEAEQLRVDNIGQADAMRLQAARSAVEARMGQALSPDAKVTAAAAEALATGVPPQDPQGPQGPQGPPSLRGKTYAQAKAEADEFTVQMNTAVAQANRIADLKGWTKDDPRRQNLLIDTRTAIHSGVVEQLIQKGKTQAAKDYVAKLDERQVTPKAMGEMQSLVRRAAVNEVGTNAAIGVVAKVDNLIADAAKKEGVEGFDASEVFGGDAYIAGIQQIDEDYAAGRLDADSRKVALAEFENVHARRRQAWSDKSREALQEAERVLNANKNLRIDSADFPAKLRNNLSKYGKLSDAEKFVGGLRRVTTDMDYGQLMDDVDRGVLRGMSNSDLFNRYYAKMSPQHWEEAKSLHAAVNQAGKETAVKDTVFLKTIANSNGVIENAEGPKGEEEMRRYGRFLLELQKRVDREPRAPGRDVSDARVREIAGEMLAEPKFKLDVNWGTDKDVYLWELTKIERRSAYTTEFGSMVYLKGGETGVEKELTRYFGDAIAERNVGKISWLSQNIPGDDFDEVKEQAEKLARDNAVMRGQPKGSAVVSFDDFRDAWLQLQADRQKKLREEQARLYEERRARLGLDFLGRPMNRGKPEGSGFGYSSPWDR